MDTGLPPPGGCAFAPRCAAADDRCRSMVPVLEEVQAGEFAACHHWRRHGSPVLGDGDLRTT